MLKTFIILCLILPAILLSGCATTYNPATEQQELVFVTTSMEVALGKMLAARIPSQFKISKDNLYIDRIKKIGENIARVSDRKDLEYHFAVIEDEGLNAFTSPGGYLYVNSGVMEKSSDDELACVIGHEVGHVAARHVAKKLQAQLGYDILMNIAMRNNAGLRSLQKAASISYNLITLGYSREDELLADRLGVKYAYKAGYDPYAMVSFLEKIKESKGEELGFIFLRSHPYAAQRIKMLKMQIPAIIDKIDRKNDIKAVRQTQLPKRSEPAPITIKKERPLRVMCPTCKKIFSGQTNYCPYDGTALH